ncbi:MAG: D-alanyl-D-alanine carboxypeptidase [Lachnospiraceae bacterium]|nr:D-alanyl-D-alanine carboxypeptidase [Lachnospiraceae bacterium]
MRLILKKITTFLLSVTLVFWILPVRAAASYEVPGTYQVQADAGTAYTVKTLDYEYNNNTYFSLRDMAMVLKDTNKAFSLAITKNSIALDPGMAYEPVGGENDSWDSSENPNISLRRNEFKVNGQNRFYYTLIVMMPSGYYDCFMMAADLAMILDMDVTVSDDGLLQIHTQEPFSVSPASLVQAGYFYGVNSVLAGDATTGEIYYKYQADTAYPIASISKLMTYLLVMDALSAGQITLEDQVVVSDAAYALSISDDGVIALEAGEEVVLQDLLYGSLLASSNECTLCLAEAVAGSEGVFVQMMNQKANELGLSQAVFFNSNGLPVYTKDTVPAKLQNRMSAEDMFRLVSYLLRVYPQITDITSLKSASLESLGIVVNSTNPLLYNMPGVTGLKTGTTNKAGACLVTSLTADDGNMEHDLVVVVLGTEDSVERGRVSGLLAKYALEVFHTGADESEIPVQPQNMPVRAEAVVDCILRTARKH